MWRGDPAGNPGPWPPPGELAGVGIFTILLAAGLTLAVYAGLTQRAHRTKVLTVLACLGSAWLMRFHFAGRFAATHDVALFPRTTIEIFHCLVLLTGVGIFWTVRTAQVGLLSLRRRARRSPGLPAVARTTRIKSVSQRLALPMALLLGMCFLIASIGGSLADRYMPDTVKNSNGKLAFVSHTQRLLDGTCPRYAPEKACDRSKRIIPRPASRAPARD